MAQIFGYARVSTREQNEARQLLALREFGVEDERIFTDRQSGKDFDRPAYCRLVRRLRPGDTLAVKSIDRLGRNYREILEQWRILTHERRVGVVVLEVPPAFAEVYRRWNSGEMSSRAAAERLGISQPTFLRWVRETP